MRLRGMSLKGERCTFLYLFLCLVNWTLDVMAGTVVSTLEHEDKSYFLGIVKSQKESRSFLETFSNRTTPLALDCSPLNVCHMIEGEKIELNLVI